MRKKKETKRYNINQKSTLSCYFQVEKFKSDGSITYKGPKFHNVILDVGLDLFAEDDLYRIVKYCNVGTGTSTPVEGQSGLDSYLATDIWESGVDPVYSVTHHTTSTDPLYYGKEETREFAIGKCTGNLTEVGLSKEKNDEYFNRQLFRDETGTPITITVASDEGLRVTFDVRVYTIMEREVLYPGSFDLSGTTINFDHQINHDAFSYADPDSTYSGSLHTMFYGGNVLGWVGSETTAHIAASDGVSGTVCSTNDSDTYLAGNFYRDTPLVWAPDDFAGDINRIVIGYNAGGASSRGLSTFLLGTPITVLDTEELTLNIRRSWGRYDEYS